MKTALMIMAILLCPGIVMGIVSSYRAGQKPHRGLYRQLQKFTHKKK
jgi:hypothetical protein